MKYTKEEWELRYPKNAGSFEITVDGIVSIASIHNSYSDLEEQEANAKLISAAPNLLEVAIMAVKIIDEVYDMEVATINKGSLAKIKQAISKAVD